jgi:hypothetical protein
MAGAILQTISSSETVCSYFQSVKLNSTGNEAAHFVTDVRSKELLGEQSAESSELNREEVLIPAKHLRNHSLLGIIYRDIQVQVAEIQCLVVIHVPHLSLTSAVKCQYSESVNAILHAMCARNVPLIAMI